MLGSVVSGGNHTGIVHLKFRRAGRAIAAIDDVRVADMLGALTRRGGDVAGIIQFGFSDGALVVVSPTGGSAQLRTTDRDDSFRMLGRSGHGGAVLAGNALW